MSVLKPSSTDMKVWTCLFYLLKHMDQQQLLFKSHDDSFCLQIQIKTINKLLHEKKHNFLWQVGY